MGFKFEKLKVWQKAVELSLLVHDVSRTFPKEELYILTSQIKRAADSVSLNIAEGSTGQTAPEFKRFLSIAMGSAIEVVGCLHLAQKRSMISSQDFSIIKARCEEIVVTIGALKRSLK